MIDLTTFRLPLASPALFDAESLIIMLLNADNYFSVQSVSDFIHHFVVHHRIDARQFSVDVVYTSDSRVSLWKIKMQQFAKHNDTSSVV